VLLRVAISAVCVVMAATATWAIAAMITAHDITSYTGPVMPLNVPDQQNPKLRRTAQRVYDVTSGQARYLLGTVHVWKWDPGMKLLTESRSTENWIRPNASSVEGFAFLYRFGPYDAQEVGVTREKLLAETIIPMMRYLVTTHVTGDRATGDGKKWGDMWQSAHWACSLGRAAWYAWDDLPQDLRDGVRRVVAHEADRFVGKTPPHQVRDDTKAEENAWNSTILSCAVLLMPEDARRPGWETEFQRWAISSFLRPADAESDELVDGKPLREQFTGANIHDDFTLENHRRVHPDYMTAFSLTMDCALDYELTGRTAPQVLSHNASGLYDNLKWFTLPDGGYIYPMGQDWRLFRNPDWLNAHVPMATLLGDKDAWSLAMRSLDAAEKMQSRSKSGAVYADGEYFFASTQHSLFRAYSRTWLDLQLAKSIVDRPTEKLGVRYLQNGKIMLNRTPSAVHTCAWGQNTMAQCVPMNLDRIMSPDMRDGIGSVRLAGATKDLPIRLREVDAKHGEDWFDVALVVDHGDDVGAHLRFESKPDGSLNVTEKLVALRDVKVQRIATGLFGILNDAGWIYERGKRSISKGGRETDVASSSGATVDLEGSKMISIDGILRFESKEPLRARYIAATNPDRGRVTDLLYLNWIDEPKEWQKGDLISEYSVTIRAAAPTP
jgi:hypothetical protein